MRPSTQKILRNAFHSFTRPQSQARPRRTARRLLFGLASASMFAEQTFASNNDGIISLLDVNTGVHSLTRTSPTPQQRPNARTGPYTSLSQDQKTRVVLLEP